ncbi:MAG TPA: GWxTD domain-containing protein [Thermoanaerobaculia bacterium]
MEKVGSNFARWRLAAALAVLSWLALACQSAPRRPAGGAGLDEGPTRWLMLPEEQRQYRNLRSTRDVVDFIEQFWLRRDPHPDQPGNEFSKDFYERVEAADRLYSDGSARGSLTDRGRALILLGPPPVLRYSQRRVPTWNPGKPGAPPAVHSQTLSLESWVYTVPDLPPALRQLIEEDDPRPEIELIFAVEPRRTYLIEGEDYLEMAVKAAVRE